MKMKAALIPLVFGVATVATLMGAIKLIDFDTAPGISSHPAEFWPPQSNLTRARGSKQIVVIAHPQCSCTKATLEELSSIRQVPVTVLFYRPAADFDWSKSDVWKLAHALNGASTVWDNGGIEARLFGSSTSGSVLLYGERGELLFHGGITPSRGHAGESRGLFELKAAIRTGVPSELSAPVFGCSLLSSGTRP